ncbi:hypothetical protein HDU79_009509 [Rhizoclosmatium sp. JEL0117]|nr:hypothetical protein HDU79_009509 [Rhizoclosmatium sp. JEL0117]
MKQAASLILCKPVGRDGLFEVLMVKRNAQGTFKSLHVFPGGALDQSDNDSAWAPPASSSTNSSPALLPFRVAALRETFEECGITHQHILSNSNTSNSIQLDPKSLSDWQRRVKEDSTSYITFCKTASLPPLPTTSLVHWSHWQTPAPEKRRFDTHFFLTTLTTASPTPVIADATEIVDLEWLQPSAAIAAFQSGRIRLIPPQFLTMMELSRYTFEDLCALVKGEKERRVPGTCQPEPFKCKEDGGVLLLPGDLNHSATVNMVSRGEVQSGTKNRLKFGIADGVVTSIRIITTGGNDAMGALPNNTAKL